MRKVLTFNKLRNIFEFYLGVKLRRDLDVIWQKVADKKMKNGKWKYIWHLHAAFTSKDCNFISSDLEINCCKLPKMMTQSEVKKMFVEKWKSCDVNYQHYYFSGDAEKEARQWKSIYLEHMSLEQYDDVLAEAKIKDRFKKLRELDGMQDSELLLKLAIFGIS